VDVALSIGISASADENDAINRDAVDGVIVPIPPLLVALIDREKEKGAPLTQREVEALRDQARCLVLPPSVARALQAQRGYADIDRDNCWEDWCARRERLSFRCSRACVLELPPLRSGGGLGRGPQVAPHPWSKAQHRPPE
jgi:hypothetical protein